MSAQKLMKKPFVLLVLFVILLGASFYFLSKNPYLQGTKAQTTEGVTPVNTQEVRTDGEEFAGLAIFPTWNIGEAITLPLLFDGEVKGFWFFEATFPVMLERPDGTIIGEGFAQAQGDWMTTDLVPFYATVEAKSGVAPYTGPAKLLLRRHNASGLPEHDAEFALDVIVDTTQ